MHRWRPQNLGGSNDSLLAVALRRHWQAKLLSGGGGVDVYQGWTKFGKRGNHLILDCKCQPRIIVIDLISGFEGAQSGYCQADTNDQSITITIALSASIAHG
jgi:hypothetical protein